MDYSFLLKSRTNTLFVPTKTTISIMFCHQRDAGHILKTSATGFSRRIWQTCGVRQLAVGELRMTCHFVLPFTLAVHKELLKWAAPGDPRGPDCSAVRMHCTLLSRAGYCSHLYKGFNKTLYNKAFRTILFPIECHNLICEGIV